MSKECCTYKDSHSYHKVLRNKIRTLNTIIPGRNAKQLLLNDYENKTNKNYIMPNFVLISLRFFGDYRSRKPLLIPRILISTFQTFVVVLVVLWTDLTNHEVTLFTNHLHYGVIAQTFLGVYCNDITAKSVYLGFMALQQSSRHVARSIQWQQLQSPDDVMNADTTGFGCQTKQQ